MTAEHQKKDTKPDLQSIVGDALSTGSTGGLQGSRATAFFSNDSEFLASCDLFCKIFRCVPN